MNINQQMNMINSKVCNQVFLKIENCLNGVNQLNQNENNQNFYEKTINTMVNGYLTCIQDNFLKCCKENTSNFFENNYNDVQDKQFKQQDTSIQQIQHDNKQINQQQQQQQQQQQNIQQYKEFQIQMESNQQQTPQVLRKKDRKNDLFDNNNNQCSEQQQQIQQQDDNNLDFDEEIQQIQQQQQNNEEYLQNNKQHQQESQNEDNNNININNNNDDISQNNESDQMQQIEFGNLNPKKQLENPESQGDLQIKDGKNQLDFEDVSDDSDLSDSEDKFEYKNKEFEDFEDFEKEKVEKACLKIKIQKEEFLCKKWSGETWVQDKSEQLDVGNVVELYEASFEISKDKYAQIYVQSLKKRIEFLNNKDSKNYQKYLFQTFNELQSLKQRARNVCMKYLKIEQKDLDSIIQLMQTDYNNEQYETLVCNNDTQFNEYVLNIWEKENKHEPLNMDQQKEYILQEIEALDDIKDNNLHQDFFLSLLVNGKGDELPSILGQIVNDMTFITSGFYWFQVYDDNIMQELVINEDKELVEYYGQKEKVFSEIVDELIQKFQELDAKQKENLQKNLIE